MNKILIRWGIWLVLMTLIVIYFDFGDLENKPELEKTSREFVESNLPAILDKWDQNEVEKLASEPLAKAFKDKPEQFTTMFDRYKSLGKIKSLGTYDGAVVEQTSHQGIKAVFALYRVGYQFENGDANITVQLIQENQAWRILGINVKPKKRG